MSGAGKKIVDVAKKVAASKGIDWDGMSKLMVSDEARREFANLRRAFDEVNHELQTKFSQMVCRNIGTLFGFLSFNFWTIAICRMLVGVGEASFISLAPPCIVDVAPVAKKTAWLGIFFMCIPAGVAFGYVLDGLPEMIGHYLAEFSISYKPVKHGRPGIGATHSSRFIPLK